jgi:predicted dithiol-disulfide oxidoreductase (DUF899 family)
MNTPPIVSTQEWTAAHQELLVKEKEVMRAHDALAAQRRRMPWLAVDKDYEFEGPREKSTCWGCFRAGASYSSTAPSSGPTSTAGPIMAAAAAR